MRIIQEKHLKGLQEISNYILRVVAVREGGVLLDGTRNKEVITTGGLLSLVAGYAYKEEERWVRGVLLDLVRESGSASGLMVVLLYMGLKKEKQIVREGWGSSLIGLRSQYTWSQFKEEGESGLESKLNEKLDLLEGGEGVHVHLLGDGSYKGVGMEVELRDGYFIDGKDIKIEQGLQESEEGAVIWCIGELKYRTYEYLDIQQVIDDFLTCEDFKGRKLYIIGTSVDIRRMFISPDGSWKKLQGEGKQRVRIVELKGATVGGGEEDLKDIEAYTGASIIRGEYGYAYKVEISSRGMLIEPYGEEKFIESTEMRVNELLSRIDSPNSTGGSVYNVEGLRKRIAKLRGLLVTVGVGGVTEAEAKNNRGFAERKVKDVLEKRRSGIVKGGVKLIEAVTCLELSEGDKERLREVTEGAEYSYEEMEVGLRRVHSLLETLNQVSLVLLKG